jgi:hypothetical protein
MAAAASAQALSQNQGPNFGTWTIGWIDLQLAASGGNGSYAWSLVPGSGSLPPGVSLRTDVPSYYPLNATAGLFGIATTPGNYAFTLRVTSAGQSVDRAYTWRISGLTDRDPNPPDAFVGQLYSYQFSAVNNVGTVTWTATSPFPSGLFLSPGGLLSGVPTTAGFVNVNFRLDDGVDQTFHGRGLSIFAIDIPTSGSLPNATQFGDYSTTINAIGGSGGYTFTACPGNNFSVSCVPGAVALPTGLSMDSTGVISGNVSGGPGKYSFTVTATDTNHVSYTKSMSIVVVAAPPAFPTVTPYGNLFDDCTLGQSCNIALFLNSGGGAPFSWTANGLPPGMSIRTGSVITSQWVIPGDAEIWGLPTGWDYNG